MRGETTISVRAQLAGLPAAHRRVHAERLRLVARREHDAPADDDRPSPAARGCRAARPTRRRSRGRRGGSSPRLGRTYVRRWYPADDDRHRGRRGDLRRDGRSRPRPPARADRREGASSRRTPAAVGWPVRGPRGLRAVRRRAHRHHHLGGDARRAVHGRRRRDPGGPHAGHRERERQAVRHRRGASLDDPGRQSGDGLTSRSTRPAMLAVLGVEA